MPATSKKSVKPKTPSTYTYTGCWTCRRRRIKCGEERPVCQRCVKAGFECQGYGFRFAGSDSTRSFRRPIASSSGTHQQPALTNAEVSKIIEDLDSASSSTEKGPFSVLSFGNDGSGEETGEQDEHPRQSRHIAIRQGRPSLTARNSSSQGSTSTDSEDSRSMVSTRTQSVTPPILLREPPPLILTPRQGELLEHWTTYVCNNMAPVAVSPINPYRTIYPALALQGIAAGPDVSPARLAVFNAICGTAAWSMSKINVRDPSYRTLSVNHDQLALQYIQQSIEQPGGVQDVAIPAAIMACLTGDTVSSRLDLWGRHLRGGLRSLLSVLVKRKGTEDQQIISALCQQYLLGVAFGKGGTVADAEVLQSHISNEGLYIEECHCITREMLDVVVEINALAAFGQHRQDPVKIEIVRQKLLRSAPTFRDYLRHHISHAYYAAIQIYFDREVQRTGETQHIASKAIDHLETARRAGQGHFGQVLMWALLQIAPECTTIDLQTRLLAWYNAQLSSHVGRMDTFMTSLRRQWEIAQYPHGPQQNQNESRIEEISSEPTSSDLPRP